MGNTTSSSSSNNNKVIVQIPVEESIFPPNQLPYTLRDMIGTNSSNHNTNHDDTTNNSSSNSSSSSSSSSSILQSRYGYMIDTGVGTTAIGSSGGGASDTTITNYNHHHNNNTQHFYHSTSGRMMKTFPLRQQQQQRQQHSAAATMQRKQPHATTPTTTSSSRSKSCGSTAVVKVTWLLEQSVVDDTTTTNNNNKSNQQLQLQPSVVSSSSFHTTTWLEQHIQELQRIRTMTKNLPFIAPYVDWGYINQQHSTSTTNHTTTSLTSTATISSNNNSSSSNNPPIIPVSKQMIHNIRMIPHNQKYYLSSSSSSLPPNNNNSFSTPAVPTTTTLRAVYVLRSAVYTTLADRLSCRPFLTRIEKLYITYQLLSAIHILHTQCRVIHGCITTENIGLTSTGYVILLDISSPYKGKTKLPDDDPSEYVYYFQSTSTATTTTSTTNHNSNKNHFSGPTTSSSNTSTNTGTTTTTTTTATNNHQNHTSTTTIGGGGGGYTNSSTTTGSNNTNRNNRRTTSSEKRCYLAPERFYTPTTTTTTTKKKNAVTTGGVTSSSTTSTTTPSPLQENDNIEPPLTVQMDIFSLGCVLTELFCNGERCFDLGDIMEYRRLNHHTTGSSSSSSSSSSSTASSSTCILPNTIQQKLNKIDDSTIRAACKHMMQIDPKERCRTVHDYYIRLFHSTTATSTTPTPITAGSSNNSNKYPTSVFHRYTNLLQQMMTGTMDGNMNNDDIVAGGSCRNPSMVGTGTATRNDAYAKATTSGRVMTTTTNTSSNIGMDTKPIISPDARILLLVVEYRHVVYETMGIRDIVATQYFDRIIGPTLLRQQQQQQSTSTTGETQIMNNNKGEATKGDSSSSSAEVIGSDAYTQKLFANVEALLNDLDSSTTTTATIGDLPDIIDETTLLTSIGPIHDRSNLMSLHGTVPVYPHQFSKNDDNRNIVEIRSDLCKSSLLIYVQIILSTIRHVQRPITKVIALQLLQHLLYYVSDDVRLQRIVPVTVSLLHDSDPLVRATAVQVVTTTVSMITSFPPSDSKIFPQYIFKRVAHMINDPAIIVRVTFARCIATLAETAQRFLDISHTVRLYELVGNETTSSTSGLTSRDETTPQQRLRGIGLDAENESDCIATTTIFNDEVVKLLDAESRVSSGISLATEPNDGAMEPSHVAGTDDTSIPVAAKTLIINTYSSELTSLQETISRWVVHIATDQSEHCSLPKQAIVSDLDRLCAFFGLEGVMSFILPQVLAFLNERKHWQLRSSLFEHLPSVCQCIGRAATEEFVLPCIEIGLVDSEERVICSALMCLSRIASTGLLSRLAILGNAEKQENKENLSLINLYAPLLLYPSETIRQNAIKAFLAICLWIGLPDCEVFIFPILRPYFLSRIESKSLQSENEFQKLLKPAWSREKVTRILEEIQSSAKARAWTPGAWTSIGVTENDGKKESPAAIDSEAPSKGPPQDPEEHNMKEYLKILSRHLTQSSMQDRSLSEKTALGLANGIEGSAKLAQSIMFAKQNGGAKKDTIPAWYNNLRSTVEHSKISVSESVSIRSVSTLGQVYGLSIMGIEGNITNEYSTAECLSLSEAGAQSVLHSLESVSIDGAYRGEWGSESVQDPEIVDTNLIVTKLKALRVPPLPLDLGDPTQWHSVRGPSTMDFPVSVDWKPRPKSLLATSSAINGHTAPITRLAVSMDQTFFASSSYDGTCRVWESQQMDDSGGLLESSILYNEHSTNGPVRINDIAMIEGSYSIVSGASDGSVHVWRVDMVKGAGVAAHSNQAAKISRSRTVGTTNMRTVDTQEGEVLAVSHFNSSSASIITFGTQRGIVHSWDLRCANEPFKLQYSPELGYLTSMALGSDRNWIVSGTSKGYVALWDIRFQQCVQLWRHDRCAPINRLATSTVPVPELWGNNVRPFLFVAAATNECSMFDVLSSTCTQSFRSVDGDSRNLNSQVDDPPKLLDISFNTSRHSGMVKASTMQNDAKYVPPLSSINSMVGSIGAKSNSYLITGGSDCSIRFWDFATPSNCFIINGSNHMHSRATYERIDFQGERHLMLCRQSQHQGMRDANKLPRKIFHGLKKPEQNHSESILDIKVLDNNGILSCSRDCTVKVWK